MSRVAVIGAGNLGCYLGVHLALAGHEVFFCARRPVGAIEIAGLPPTAIPWFQVNPPAADIVLLTVKTYDTPSAMIWLDGLCSEGQPVAVVQNGVHHARRVAPFRAIPVLSYVYVEACDGVFQAYTPGRAALSTATGEAAEAFASLFRGTGIEVRNEANFPVEAWRKMIHNCVSNPLTALAGRGLEILAEPKYRAWAQQIIEEGLLVARAEGAGLDGDGVGSILSVLTSYPPGTRTSMLQDKEKCKRLELDALNGKLVGLAEHHGVAVPANRELLKELGYSSSRKQLANARSSTSSFNSNGSFSK